MWLSSVPLTNFILSQWHWKDTSRHNLKDLNSIITLDRKLTGKLSTTRKDRGNNSQHQQTPVFPPYLAVRSQSSEVELYLTGSPEALANTSWGLITLEP